MNSKLKAILSFLLMGFFASELIFAQSVEPSRQELENVLSRFLNYRFGTVSIYKVKNISDIKRALKTTSEVGAGKKEAEELMKSLEPVVVSVITRGVEAGDPCDKIREDMLNQGLIPPEAAVFEKICSGMKSGSNVQDLVENAYLITTRPTRGQIPNTVIALIISDRLGDDLEKNLRTRATSDIYTNEELKAFKLDTTFSSSNLHDLMVNAIMQGNIENKTLDAQGIGKAEWFAPRVYGKTFSLIGSETDITPSDVQKFMRISEGQALDYGTKSNEVIASLDLISWKRYAKSTYTDNAGNLIVDSSANSNDGLPIFGIELKYGADNISYPSFWSERMTLSALWQSVKLGIILPTDGWSAMTSSVYNIDRKLTNGGVGLSGTFDFPFKVVPQSGVFKLSGNYVFGDANAPSYKNRNISDPDAYDLATGGTDYLLRTDVQLHYTFGVAIDNDYWFRFGIGGTIYAAESWNYSKIPNTDPNSEFANKLVYSKSGSETVGGLSGKIEFLSKNITTPFGGSVQYFDEALGLNVWLQIPVVENLFAIRLDASGYIVAFRGTPHAWENQSVFIPQARFIINF
jgi:hypothetical protein